MRKYILTATLLILCFIEGQAQMLNSTTGPSVEALSVEKTQEIDVNYYTGRPNITIPIYTIKDGDLEIPISLSWVSDGVKTRELRTKVGLGWELNVGGVLNREINGWPDELDRRGYFVNKYDTWAERYAHALASYLGVSTCFAQVSKPLECEHNASNTFKVIYDQGNVDIGPDSYSFSFMGYSGKYIYTKNNSSFSNTSKRLFFQSESPVSLYFNNQFIFEDIYGYKYDFLEGDHIAGKELNSSANNMEYAYIVTDNQPHSTNGNYFWSSRYLNKLISPTGRIAQFEYTTTKRKLKDAVIDYYIDGWINPGLDMHDPYTLPLSITGDECQLYKPIGTIKDGTSKRIGRIIKKITTPNYRIEFECNDLETGQQDPLEDKITGIKIYYKYVLVKHILFTQTTFATSGSAGILKLDGIAEKAPNKNEKINLYNFSYYTPYGEIEKESTSSDYWGYITLNQSYKYWVDFKPLYDYKGDISGFDLDKDFNRLPSYNNRDQYSIEGMLKSIKYPTGGTVYLNWENHTYTHVGTFSNNVSKENDPPSYISDNVKLKWNFVVPDIKKRLTDISGLKISASRFYPVENYVEALPQEQDWQDWTIGVLGNPALSMYAKDILRDMPIVYIVKAGTDTTGIAKNIFDDSRVIDYCIINNEMILDNKTVNLKYLNGSFDIYLKPGKLKPDNQVVGGKNRTAALLRMDGMYSEVNIQYYKEARKVSNGEERVCGGFRVKSMIVSDGNKSVIKNFKYTDGVLVEAPRVAEDYTVTTLCLNDYGMGLGVSYAEEFIRWYAFAVNRSNTKGSHIGYSEVSVYEKNTSSQIDYQKMTSYSFSTSKDNDGFTASDLDESLINQAIYLPGLTPWGHDISIKYGNVTSKDHYRGLLLSKFENDLSTNTSILTNYKYDIIERQYMDEFDYIPNGIRFISSVSVGGKMPGSSIETPFSLTQNTSPSTRSDFNNCPDYIPPRKGGDRDPSNRLGMYGYSYKELTNTYAIGAYRLIPYIKRIKEEEVQVVSSNGTIAYTTTYDYNVNQYPSLSSHDPSASLPIRKIVAYKNRSDGSSEVVKETTYNYQKGKVRTEAVWENQKIIAAIQNEYNSNGLITAKKQAIIKEDKTEKNMDYLTFRNLEQYSYLVGNPNPTKVTQYENRATTYLWKNDRLLGEFINFSDENLINQCNTCAEARTKAGGAFVKCITYDTRFPDKIASIEDENELKTYYEYDDFGRLLYIKDNSKNIIKHYQYNYAK